MANVIIVVKGGCVTEVYCDRHAEVAVYDLDNPGDEEVQPLVNALRKDRSMTHCY
jgi:hypothetical protein